MIQMKGKHSLSINKGQIVHCTPMMLHALCMDGFKVTRVHGGKVYSRNEDGVEFFVKQSSVIFVCDTTEESRQIEELSRQMRSSIMETIKITTDAIHRTLDCIIQESAETVTT